MYSDEESPEDIKENDEEEGDFSNNDDLKELDF